LILKQFWNSAKLRNSKTILQDPSDLKFKPLKKLVWLDDFRNPDDKTSYWLAYSLIGRKVEIIWVKNTAEFKGWIIANGLPDAICFDHDLGENEPTGYDGAKWLVDYCLDHRKDLPLWACQSANPVGRENI
jgi:hypothetical protein